MADVIPAPEEPSGAAPRWSKDDKARREVQLWPDEAGLRGRRMKNEDTLLQVFGWLTPTLVCIFALLFVVALGAWAFHYVTPWSFLNPDQLSKIQSVIFSGTLGAIVSSLAGPYFKNKRDKDE